MRNRIDCRALGIQRWFEVRTLRTDRELPAFESARETGAFLLNVDDHEVESTTIMHRRNVPEAPPFSDILLKKLGKLVNAGFPGVCENRKENDSKTLALCAARSHIVAVR